MLLENLGVRKGNFVELLTCETCRGYFNDRHDVDQSWNGACTSSNYGTERTVTLVCVGLISIYLSKLESSEGGQSDEWTEESRGSSGKLEELELDELSMGITCITGVS
jgi:hypothetical protein